MKLQVTVIIRFKFFIVENDNIRRFLWTSKKHDFYKFLWQYDVMAIMKHTCLRTYYVWNAISFKYSLEIYMEQCAQ